MKVPSAQTHHIFIEALVITGFLAIIALFFFTKTTQPALELTQQQNSKRKADVETFVNLLTEYERHNRSYPKGVSSVSAEIAKDALDICPALVSTFAAQLPFDPATGHFNDCKDYDTGYTVYLPSRDHVVVSAPSAVGEVINATK